MDSASSGILVIESPPGGAPIPACRETVAAFIGPAPRGPVDMPVAVRSVAEFLARFGVAGHPSRLELLLQQYFDNGGVAAVVVRVASSARRNRIVLPGAAGALVLEALNPGPLEHLRASVDYDGIAPAATDRFNLVIHRCRSPDSPLVEQQEGYHNVSILPDQADFLGHALADSRLVELAGEPPAERPTRTVGPEGEHSVAYIYCRSDWHDAGAPTDYDLIGSREEGAGLFALEQVPTVDLVYVLPGTPDGQIGPVALFAAERYCQARHAMLILDPPAAWASVADVVRAQRERGFTSANALTYFPALENPSEAGGAGTCSAAGAIMGMLARGDVAAGCWRTPAACAALSLGRSRPAVALEEPRISQLNRLGVNVLVRPAPGRVALRGPVTLARSGGLSASWNDLRRRRTALFILSGIARHTRWSAFSVTGAGICDELREQVGAFLAELHARGALAGSHPREAFFVKCDADTSGAGGTPAAAVTLVVGFALHRPGEFLVFRLRHDAEDCRVSEIDWRPGLALAG
jgi:phage tail sheath protein FI